ncbi:MAG: hypothetical protein A2X36_13310 [Elusimicrobia bacterium GWA2_69_24]|nr:MAG: hypothetical protein A2X36_13310 [Elusimicrobia bacterium GWA2_69_24]HBL15760.1 hypothetical protein [Elusimicrobiota bacterium]
MMQMLLDPFRQLAQRFMEWAPGVVAAFLILLLGLVLARALRSFMEGALTRAKIDEYASKVGVHEVFTRLGFGKSPTYALCFMVYWFVLLMCFVAAADAVNLPVVKELLARFVNFLPELLAAILILFGGLLFARFLSEVVANAAAANNIGGGHFLSKATYGVILVFASLMALEHLGIRMALVTMSLQILLASLGLGFALAFGLGARDLAGEYLRGLIEKKKD